MISYPSDENCWQHMHVPGMFYAVNIAEFLHCFHQFIIECAMIHMRGNSVSSDKLVQGWFVLEKKKSGEQCLGRLNFI